MNKLRCIELLDLIEEGKLYSRLELANSLDVLERQVSRRREEVDKYGIDIKHSAGREIGGYILHKCDKCVKCSNWLRYKSEKKDLGFCTILNSDKEFYDTCKNFLKRNHNTEIQYIDSFITSHDELKRKLQAFTKEELATALINIMEKESNQDIIQLQEIYDKINGIIEGEK